MAADEVARGLRDFVEWLRVPWVARGAYERLELNNPCGETEFEQRDGEE
jgi:outer membrane biogenesis lipoprotein LolB